MKSNICPSSICAYDREVTVQQLTETVGASGFPVETWIDLDVVWMMKVSGRQTEQFNGSQLSGPLVQKWQMYFRDDMDPDLIDIVKTRRLKYLGRIYDITSAQEIGRHEGVELMTLAHTGGN